MSPSRVRAVALASALFLWTAPAAAQDSLSVQTFALGSEVHRALASSPDSLTDVARALMLRALEPLAAACRSTALSPREEPRRPHLSWRTIGHIHADSCSWTFGALSCVDTLCGGLVPHDRLAALRVGRQRSTLSLYPGEPATIGDAWVARLDSATIYPVASHRLVHTWRRVSSDHPCWGGPDSYRSESAYFLVVRNDRITHAFQLLAHADTVSGDAVEGDTGTAVRSYLQLSANIIDMTTRIDQWANTPAGDADSTRTKTRRQGIELVFDPKSGRFKRAP